MCIKYWGQRPAGQTSGWMLMNWRTIWIWLMLILHLSITDWFSVTLSAHLTVKCLQTRNFSKWKANILWSVWLWVVPAVVSIVGDGFNHFQYSLPVRTLWHQFVNRLLHCSVTAANIKTDGPGPNLSPTLLRCIPQTMSQLILTDECSFESISSGNMEANLCGGHL